MAMVMTAFPVLIPLRMFNGNTSTPVSSAMEIHNSIQTPCMKLNMPVTI